MAAKKMNAFYAQSGGVTAVINASACGVIETARKHKDKIGKVYAGRNGIIGALTEDLIDTSKESASAIAALRSHAVRRLRFLPLQAEEPGSQQARVRAPDRGLQGAQHRLLLLQRRRRLRRHLPQGLATAARPWVIRSRPSTCPRRSTTTCRSPTTARASARWPSTSPSRRSKPASTCARWRDVDQGLRARSHGPPRRLDRRRGRPGIDRGHRIPDRHPVPRGALRPEEIPRQGRWPGQEVRLLHRGGLRGLPLPGRQVPRRAGHARRLRSRPTGRCGTGGRQHDQGCARPQVPLGRGRLPAARRAPHRFQDRRRSGLRHGQGRGRVGAAGPELGDADGRAYLRTSPTSGRSAWRRFPRWPTSRR